jgi:deoxyribonuclease IV
MSLLLGAHMSIAGGLDRAFDRGEEVGCTAMQIFTANASRWHGKPVSPEAAEKFSSRWKSSTIGPVFAHDSYLINLASQDPKLLEKSKRAFLEELRRCASLGLAGVVMHPGAHLGAGENIGLDRVRSAFEEILAVSPREVMILIENTAGQGTYLGGPFNHIAALLEGFPRERFGVCFDTCHACAAGYDLSSASGYRATMDDFDRLIGFDRLQLFHVNDSLKECGSRVDRHAHIGEGAIGLAGFRNLMRDDRLAHIPKILETPKGEGGTMDRKNLELLKDLAEGTA